VVVTGSWWELSNPTRAETHAGFTASFNLFRLLAISLRYDKPLLGTIKFGEAKSKTMLS
jgi:hypothetical protein